MKVKIKFPKRENRFMLNFEGSKDLEFKDKNRGKYLKCLKAYYRWIDWYHFSNQNNKSESRAYTRRRFNKNIVK